MKFRGKTQEQAQRGQGITENDVMKGNQPIYPVERYVTIGGNKVLFGDGSHIIYVNGKYRGNDEIGKLMHDFSCTNPDDMNYETLAKKARYFKQDEKVQLRNVNR